MNKFETGHRDPAENIPHEEILEDKEQQGGSFEDFKKKLQSAENEGLSSVETKESTASHLLKKALCAVTAGVMLFSATPAFAQEKGQQLTEKQKIELQIQKLQGQKMQLERQESEMRHAERIKELNNYLDYFNINGLKLGEVKMRDRCPCEQFGVYLEGKHLGDIYSDDKSTTFYTELTFSQRKLIEDVSNILRENGIQFETGLSKPQNSKPQSPESIDTKVNISSEAQKILESWGGYYDSAKATIYIGGPQKLVIDASTKNVSVIAAGSDMLIVTCIDFDGKRTIVTCVNKMVKNVSKFK